VVFHRASGLTAADLAVMRKDFAYFTSNPPQHTAPPVWGGPPSDPRSPDHRVATFSMAILSVNQDTVKAAVDSMRQHLGLGAAGLDIRVTGPAGLLDDIMGLVSSIDGLILGATLLLVLVLLLLIYRSPLLALLPIVTVALAYTVAGGLVYLLAKNAGLTLNGEAGFLLPVLMFGAGTDYSLLLINRYREELHRNADKHAAMAETLRTESPAVLSSGSTVLLAMLVLLLASLRSTHNFGPVLAIGIGAALLAGLTLLPALLQVVGRPAFWPMIPRVEPERVKASGLWSRVARIVSTHTGTVLVGTLVLLVLLGLGTTTISEQQNELNGFRSPSQGTEGFSYIQASLPAGLLAPTSIVVHPASA
jgi:RND superfamily putative drug exporter